MRKVITGLFSSLDGAVEGPDKWQFDSFDAQLGELMTQVKVVTRATLPRTAGR